MIAEPALVALAGTLVAAVVDVRTGYLPNIVTRPTAVAALVLAAPSGLTTAAGGACAVGGMLMALYLITRGRGLGLGDVKLGVAMGAGLGPWCGALALGAAFISGGGYAALLLASKRAANNDAIAFGPFLALGTMIGTTIGLAFGVDTGTSFPASFPASFPVLSTIAPAFPVFARVGVSS
jgi:leader peptidase (prepilin peptidase) / N-methyltransferase